MARPPQESQRYELSDAEKRDLIALIQAGKPLPEKYRFLLFADNPGFSFSLALYNLVSLALSLFLALLMPGFAGVALASDDAMRLRMYKYDWLEQHPGLDARARKDIPWDELLAEDRELVGKRTLKGMIFPWKE